MSLVPQINDRSTWQAIKASLNLAWFHVNGRQPWSRGYSEYKRRTIESAIHDPRFDPRALPAGHGERVDERVVEYPWALSRLRSRRPGSLLDAGSALNHGYLLRHPALAGHRIHIQTFAPEPECHWYAGISYLFGDLRDNLFRDASFDEVVCLSTLEHVGLDNSEYAPGESDGSSGDHLRAVRELRRVLRPGGRLLLSVPFGTHRNHGWFQVFDGLMLDEVVKAFAPSAFSEIYFGYTSAGWVNRVRDEVLDATYFDVKTATAPAPDHAAASRAVACLELVK
ncbi:MAG: class I SAM-dependent methyltransferase [Burkholderiales bacterium]